MADDPYQKALELIAAHEEHKVYLRDEAIRLAAERDAWRVAYQDALLSREIYWEGWSR
jgi:hypothetical protein